LKTTKSNKDSYPLKGKTMKSILVSLSLTLFAISPAVAGGTHSGGHDEKGAGKPGDISNVTRLVEVKMYETDDGEMLYEPRSLSVKQGETIRFAITNAGETEHEFVLDTLEKNQEHKAQMAKFPEMEHDDPNSVRLEEGEKSEIIWEFTNSGKFEFACLIPGHYESGMRGDLEVSAH
jgi:uncharacterized cupredoxin-like copper-binding protein